MPGLASSSISWEKIIENTLMAEILLEEHPLGFLVEEH